MQQQHWKPFANINVNIWHMFCKLFLKCNFGAIRLITCKVPLQAQCYIHKKEVSSMFVSFWGEWECDHTIHIITSPCSICSRFSSEFPVSLKLLLLKHSDGKFALWLKLPDGFMRRICRVALALMFLINIKTTQDAQPLMIPTKPTSPTSFFEKYKMKWVRN